MNWTDLKRWVMPAVKLLTAVAVVWFVRGTILGAVRQLQEQRPAIHFGWLLAAGGLYLLSTLPNAYFWHRILRALEQKPTLLESLRAFTIGHLGKYVPGKAMVIVLRAGLIQSSRVSFAAAATSVFLETLTMMAVGAFLAAYILNVLFPQQWMFVFLAVGLMLLAGLPTLPPLFRFLARRIPKRSGSTDTVVPLEAITWRLLIPAWFAIAFGWCLMGLSLWATLRSLGVAVSPLVDLPLWTAAVALAMVAGFLSLIPGGLVVRDAILAQMLVLAAPVEQGPAVAAAILLRLVWILAELLISVILYFAKSRAAPANDEQPPPEDGYLPGASRV